MFLLSGCERPSDYDSDRPSRSSSPFVSHSAYYENYRKICVVAQARNFPSFCRVSCAYEIPVNVRVQTAIFVKIGQGKTDLLQLPSPLQKDTSRISQVGNGETGEVVLKVADDASYRARSIGKNCVVIAE